jgi:hypothetical protein
MIKTIIATLLLATSPALAANGQRAATPKAIGCGDGAEIIGSDFHGTLAAGRSASSCEIKFARPGDYADCVVSAQSGVGLAYVVADNGIRFGRKLDESERVTWFCGGRRQFEKR